MPAGTEHRRQATGAERGPPRGAGASEREATDGDERAIRRYRPKGRMPAGTEHRRQATGAERGPPRGAAASEREAMDGDERAIKTVGAWDRSTWSAGPLPVRNRRRR